MDQVKQIRALCDRLMVPYRQKVAYADHALKLIASQGESFINDHLAFRTLGLPGLGISALEQLFLGLGYEKKDFMHFEEKKLNAYWYAPPQWDLPKIFISELRVDELSEDSQAILKRYAATVTQNPATQVDPQNLDALVNAIEQPLWDQPSHKDYEALMKESEYAAWVLLYANQVNHFTIYVNAFKNIPGLKELDDMLEKDGIPLNESGGKIKGTPEEFLIQSSTVANKVDYDFPEGPKSVPYSYIEFAERFPEPPHQNLDASELKPEHYFQGFIPNSANKIFESTYEAQVNRAPAKA